ncbi:DNA lyase [Alkalilimnicola ehrlichii]|uniref:DNA lyase n=1 Tax=Alkalilimnicola ehrlichii TaxID=351052 RepID=A0A3E0WZ33_9GAMM|nr:pyrimidine dimer DNA glycosylase/endonuclease V [Alkalilimnicola ehrlichii]RFA30519.1 DNA lyase [Alkalilimnicola ehrlichii]RFA38068.1 DNA lyase [Alkalilimnicola ehrlichii]
MRLWTLHPRYLDAKGLVALWREALLAQAVLQELTKGYRNHPQLWRFREHATPLAAIGTYLTGVHTEALSRGYAFREDKIVCRQQVALIAATTGQIEYEWSHLRRKLNVRSSTAYARWIDVKVPECHPLFYRVEGPVEHWERK